MIPWHESSLVLTIYISDPISCGSVSSKSSSIHHDGFSFCHTWTSLIFSLYIFLNSGKSHWSSVIFLVSRSSASFSDSSSLIQKSRITCIQQQGFMNKSSKWGSHHQHCNDIGLDQKHSCWSPNSSRIYLYDIVSISWMAVRMEV